MNKFNVMIWGIVGATLVFMSAIWATAVVLHGSDSRGLFDYLMQVHK